jgi:hypothetical protein
MEAQRTGTVPWNLDTDQLEHARIADIATVQDVHAQTKSNLSVARIEILPHLVDDGIVYTGCY